MGDNAEMVKAALDEDGRGMLRCDVAPASDSEP